MSESRASQLGRVVAFFTARPDEWIPFYALLDLRPRIAQLNTRIHEARHQLGLRIQNETVRRDGGTHSFYILLKRLSEPPALPLPRANETRNHSGTHDSLFGKMTPESRYPD